MTQNTHIKHDHPALPWEIWLIGEICAGKDNIGDVLHKARGYWKMGVGELIASEIELAEALPKGYIYASHRQKEKYRDKLQAHGNLRRAENPDYWLNKWCLLRDIEGEKQPAIQVSCRFRKEAVVAMQRKAFVVRVLTPEVIRKQRITHLYPSWTPEQTNNPAEGDVDKCPFHATVYGTLGPMSIIANLIEQFYWWHQAGCPIIDPVKSTESLP